jgi:transposase
MEFFFFFRHDFGIILSMTTAQINSSEKLQIENMELRSTLEQRDQKIVHLEEQLAWFKRQIFGRKSERTVSDLNPQQLEIFDSGVPEIVSAVAEEHTQTVPAHQRRKPNRNGQDAVKLDPDMPVKTIVLDIPEEEKVCKETGLPLVKIGEEVSHKLAHEPGSYFVKEIIRPKYASAERPETGIITASMPDTILPKCQADDSLLAEICTQKFANHMPLYRIAEQMGRDGVGISRKLLSQWVVRCGTALEPLYEVMVHKILESKNVFIDESPVKLLAKEKCETAYVWVMVGGQASDPPYRVYDFREDRCHDHVWDLLKGYEGVVDSDKYAAYQRLAERKIITWCPCWSHIRRKFIEAEAGDRELRDWVLRKIRYLFMLERVAWARSPVERLRIRKEKESPIIDELTVKIKARLTDGRILPKSKLREALGYYCGLIPYLKNYTAHAFARLDNNVAERAIRPLTIGRKNWLFFGSEDGGRAGAILLSFIQTCRGLGINPREYLEDVFRRLLGYNAKKLEELLPDQWQAAKLISKRILHNHPPG